MSKLKERRERQELVKTHPGVKYHANPTECTALTSARSSLSTYHHADPEVRRRKQEHAKCKNPAHWKFTPLKNSWANKGDYCWSHLIHFGIYGDMDEEERTERWLKRKGVAA